MKYLRYVVLMVVTIFISLVILKHCVPQSILSSEQSYDVVYISKAFTEKTIVEDKVYYPSFESAISENKKDVKIVFEQDEYHVFSDISRLENVVIEGNGSTLTARVLLDDTWEVHSENIWKINLDDDVYQVFVNDEYALYSRWPNATIYDIENGEVEGKDSIWNQMNTWRGQSHLSTIGRMVDENPYMQYFSSNKNSYEVKKDQDINNELLSDLDFSVEGSMAIMNIGSWMTFVQQVDQHEVGDGFFTYSSDFTNNGPGLDWDGKNTLPMEWLYDGIVLSSRVGRYYLEGNLTFLDSKNEWYYDKDEKCLYLYSDKDPNNFDVSYRNKDLSLYGSNVNNLTIDNVRYFGTTIELHNSSDVTLSNSSFYHYGTSYRPLKNPYRPQTLEFYDSDQIRLVNNRFSYTDGPGVVFEEVTDGLIENNYFHDIDFSSQSDGNDASIKTINTQNLVFRMNTVLRAGNSETIRGGKASLIELNYVSRGGLLQNDGAAINVSPQEQEGTIVRYNWVINSGKAGIRFDGVGPDPIGIKGTVHNNVVTGTYWNNIHGDEHNIYNNTMFNNEGPDLVIAGSCLQMFGGVNQNTRVSNNLVDMLASSWFCDEPILASSSNNYELIVSTELENVETFDFRIKKKSPLDGQNLGAYNDNTYFIPGYQEEKASFAIPYDNYKGDVNALIFKSGYHSSKNTVIINDTNIIYEGTENIVDISDLESGTYTWRVDSLVDGKIVKGSVWTFTKE